jgi:nitrate/TMAO reductase-like tetraheme cytochrome c subunit
VGTQLMVAATGTNEFCSNACHSMQWVAREYAQSGHHLNRTGVTAGCHDCHIPHQYPELLWYKTKAGIKDAIGEVRGVISTEEKFKKERLRMAQSVWAEYKQNNSENCQHCHAFTAEIVAKQKDFVQPMHQQVLAKAATCIDCHRALPTRRRTRNPSPQRTVLRRLWQGARGGLVNESSRPSSGALRAQRMMTAPGSAVIRSLKTSRGDYSDSTHFTSDFTSSGLAFTAGCPFAVVSSVTIVASASALPLYLAATSLNAGPTFFVSTA